MRSLKFIFMILILLSIANAAMAQEYIFKVDNMNQVWITPPGASTFLAGTIETIPKGTLLYHWGKATPEQAKAWDEAGKISPDLLERLKQGQGFVGGGFYVSKDPTDSSSYGNVQVVVELTKDIQVIKSEPGVTWGMRLWPTLEKNGISGVGVTHTHTWMNIIDAEALTKEFVATSEFYKKNHLKQLTTRERFTDFMSKFPELEADPFYQEFGQKIDKLATDIMSTDRPAAIAAFTEVFEHGNDLSKTKALSSTYMNQRYAALSDKKTVDYALKALKGNNTLAQEAQYALAYLVKQPRQINNYVFANATKNLLLMTDLLAPMKHQLSSDRYSALLQEAKYYLAKENPYYIRKAIEDLKEKGRWNPPMMCELVFR
ncbi:MAG: hypothetical protein JSU04_12000 [Bdellovibrionales bacterium]|nr:hypothetical protein [Bdellovibrionales bacterium]